MDVKIKGLDGSLMAQSLCMIAKGILCRILGTLLLDGGQVIEILAQHSGHELHSRQLRNGIVSHEGTVPHDSDAIADCIHLLQEVRNKKDAYALRLQLVHHAEELLYLIVVQRGGGLVQNQYPAVHVHGSGNGDHLLDGDGIIFQCIGHIHLDLQTVHQLLGLPVHGLPVHRMELRLGCPADEQVLCHAQVGTEVDLLIYRCDTDVLGIHGGVVMDISLHAVHIHLALVTLIDACQTFDNGGLSCTVFSHQCMNFSLTERQLGMIQCLYTRKGLCDISHFDQHIFFFSHIVLSFRSWKRGGGLMRPPPTLIQIPL